jgi:hypothetical protein
MYRSLAFLRMSFKYKKNYMNILIARRMLGMPHINILLFGSSSHTVVSSWSPGVLMTDKSEFIPTSASCVCDLGKIA